MKILFSTPYIPYKKAKLFEDNIDFFYYRNTLRQGIFQLRQNQSWHPLHFIAQNLPVRSVVLENPTLKQFKEEINKNNYDAVALSFSIVTTQRILEMVSWIKEFYPKTDVILGGYGTSVFSENYGIEQVLKEKADYICQGEGVDFMLKYIKDKLGIERIKPLIQNLIPIQMGFFRSRVTIHQTLNIISNLGCNYHCCFCATSSQFKKKIPLFSGEGLYKSLKANANRYPNATSAVIFDEDFLADKPSVLEFMKCYEQDRELNQRPMLLTVFSSVKSISQYTLSELISSGIGMIYIGVESFSTKTLEDEKLHKRAEADVDIKSLFFRLNEAGIHTLGSIIIGWDTQTKEMASDELRQFVALNPTLYQVMPLQAIPGTPLWRKMKAESRIVPDFNYSNLRLERATFTYKHFSQAESVSMIYDTYKKLVDFGGPWPFRMFTNLRHGIKTMRQMEGVEFENRLRIYRKLIFPLYVLAVVSGGMFFGKNFRRKWAKEMKDCFTENPFYFSAACLAAFIAAPVLVIMVVWGCIRHFVLPDGDQPETIRIEYANS
jgi:hypothetical protein